MNMKRPLLVFAAGFVLGEVLALCENVVWPAVSAALLLTVIGVVYALFSEMGVMQLTFGGIKGRHQKSRGARIRVSLLFFALLWAFTGLGFGRARMVRVRLDREEEKASQFEGAKVRVRGRIVLVEEKEESVVLTLERAAARAGDREAEFERALVYLGKEETGSGVGGGNAERAGDPGSSGAEQTSGYGDAGEALSVGCQVEIRGSLASIEGPRNPGEFDFRSYYRARGIACRLYGEALLEVRGEASPYFRALTRFRSRCRAILRSVCQAEDASIYEAVLLGDTSSMDGELKTMYQRHGIAHLLAISGQHLTIIGGGIYLLLRRMGLGFRGSGIAGAILVVSYGIMTGSSGSAMRAIIMILCLWLARWAGRTYDTLSALSLASLLLLWRTPYMLVQSGFLLSFGAVLSIAGLGRWLEHTFHLEKPWQKTLAVSLSVQIVLTPVMLYFYYQYPVYGIILNLLILPLVPILMYSGLLVIAIGSFWHAGAVIAAGAGHYILLYYKWLCQTAEKLPAYCLVTGRPGWGELGVYGVVVAGGLIGLYWFFGRHCQVSAEESREAEGRAGVDPAGASQMKTGRPAVVGLFLTLCIFGAAFLTFLPKPVSGLEVLCLDVGQGDGFLLRTGTHSILIDAGSSSEKSLGNITLEPCLKSKGITQIDYAVVSHGDSDHISGLLYLLKESEDIKIKTLVLPIMGRGQDIYSQLEAQAAARGARTIYMQTGEQLTVGELSLSCLYAGEQEGAATTQDRNAHSLVLCADYKNFHMLFTGDMGAEQERRLLQSAGAGTWQSTHLSHVQVLKVAHHGSANSSSSEFLGEMPLHLAVISYGRGNSYGHPSQEVKDCLSNLSVPVMETGIGGAITIKTDGKRLRLRYYLQEKPSNTHH